MEHFEANEERTFKFLKDYKQIKKGMYLKVPTIRYTGQVHIDEIWQELEELLKNKTVTEVKNFNL